jgi:hypothetical protein
MYLFLGFHDHFTRLLNSAKIMQIQFDKTPQELVDITLGIGEGVWL